MRTPRTLRAIIFLVGLATWLSGCESTPTSPGSTPTDTSKTAQKAGPAILLALAPQAAAPTRFTLSGTVGTTGSVSLWTNVTLNGVDRSSDFTLPTSQIVTAPFDLSAFTIAAKSTAQVGEYVLTMTATDSLGNTSRASCPLSLRSKAVAAPTISGFSVDNAYLPAGLSSFNTKGSAEFATGKAIVSYAVSPAANITLPASFTLSSGGSLGKQVAIGPNVAPGAYSLTVTVTDEDGLSASQSATFSISSSGVTFDMLAPNLTVGAQNELAGSYIDVDGGLIYTGGSSKPVAEIDAIFFADAAGQISLMSPTHAASSSIGGVSAWATRQSTVVVDAGTAPVLTVGAARALIGTSSSQIAAVVSGHYYALRLANGEYAAIQIASLTGIGRSASASITLFVEP